jgi:Flp pilus assembly pilin Flp
MLRFSFLKKLLEAKGATMIEYGIMLVVVALAILLLVPDLRSLVTQIFSSIASGMDSGLSGAS